MTAKEMQKSVMQQTNAMGEEYTIPSEDVVLFINKAIDKFIKDKFEPRKNRIQLGFEQSVKRLEDLRSLVTNKTLDTSYNGTVLSTGYEIDEGTIPDDNFLLISVGQSIYYNQSGIEYELSSGKRIPASATVEGEDYGSYKSGCKFVQHDDIYSVLSDPFNGPKITKGIFTVDGNSVYTYTNDKFIVDEIALTYIKEPKKVDIDNNVSCDLSESVHEDIVDLAVKLILQSKGQVQQQPQQE